MRDIVQYANQALWLIVLLSTPPIVAASICGLLVAVFQSATQLQEQTLQYAAKFVAIVLTLFLMAGLMGGLLMHFTDFVFTAFPGLTRT